MKIGTRLPMFVVAAILLGSIALLGTLQYRWLGQVSAAERERMKSNVAGRATGFAQDFDREITRAYVTFQLDTLHQGANLARQMSERYERWHATSRYPRLVKEVFVVAGSPERSASLQRFNASTRVLEPADWPEQLAPIRHLVEQANPAAPEGSTIVVRNMPRPVWESVPALVVPAPVVLINTTETRSSTSARPLSVRDLGVPPMSFVLLTLDRSYLAGEMLPALAQQHFRGSGESIEYEVAVVRTDDRSRVYSTRAEFAPDPQGANDAAADLFQVRLQDFGGMVSEVRRFTSFVTTRAMPLDDRKAVEGRIAIREAPFSIMWQHAGTEKRALETSLAAAAGGRPATSAPQWRLVVRHPAGSLEKAVGQARRRNLLVSSGILGILGLSIGFLVLTTRRAQALARQQMEFVAAVSHELRTPLAVIRSAADNLAEGVIHADPQVMKYGALVRGEGRRLSEMVEQILELAGIHSGQRGFALAPVAVLPLLHDVVGASSTLIEEAGLRVEYDVPDTLPPVLGDEQALRRVFQNLLGNAIKYGASGGWISLRARASGREVQVSVADRGMGIEQAEQGKIFEPFYRAPGAIDAQIQGAGLGLSLVQRIIEAHGGRIAVRSVPGSGSEFIVHLPSASEEGATRAAGVADPARTSA